MEEDWMEDGRNIEKEDSNQRSQIPIIKELWKLGLRNVGKCKFVRVRHCLIALLENMRIQLRVEICTNL